MITDVQCLCSTARAASRELKVLVARDLVTIERGPDRRARIVALTTAGGETLAAAWPRWEQAQADALADLGGERVTRLMHDLRAVSALAAERAA